MRLLLDSSGGTRLRRGGRRARSPSWKTTDTWYCRACHAELHELGSGDWEVGFIGADGDVARTECLPPAGSGATRAAAAFLRGALQHGREARWDDLVREGRSAGYAEHTLLRARMALAEAGALGPTWHGRSNVAWSLREVGKVSLPQRPVRQWDSRRSRDTEAPARV